MTVSITGSSFGIGTVSRLTGIPMDTLRVWERRYGAVCPRRSAQNRRFYTREDVSRLLLIKQLVERGEPVGSIVHLPEAELRSRLAVHAEFQQQGLLAAGLEPDAGRRVSVIAYGDALPHQLRHWSGPLSALDIRAAHTLWSDFLREGRERQADIAIVEFPALSADRLGRLLELPAQLRTRRIVVVYAFSARTVLERLHQRGIQTLRAPLTPELLLGACLPVAAETPPETAILAVPRPVAPPRFDAATLAEIANREIRLPCECPHHLVELVSRLGAFEQYSLACEHRHAQDAAVHARLHAMTAEARALLEEALAFLLESEGIELAARDKGDAVLAPDPSALAIS